MGVCARYVALLGAVVVAACLPPGTLSEVPELRPVSPTSYVMRRANRGSEPYSAWFADTDGSIVYFGLSPFWTLWWAHDGDSSADLEEPGDLLIGRFDLVEERFLSPLSLRDEAAGASSVWDVLVHSSGLLCFTTYFDAMGCYDPETRRLTRFDSAGPGLNEIWEGPGGDLYVTRYTSAPQGDPYQSYGAIAVIGTDGRLLREYRLASPPGGLTAPKSLAVDPRSGDIWLNTDTFLRDTVLRKEEILHETIRLDANGVTLSRTLDPHLHFVSFSKEGKGFFAEVERETLYLRITEGDEPVARLALGPIAALDFVQDIKHGPGGEVVLALWSGAVYVVRPTEAGWSARGLALRAPAVCRPPEGRSVFYSAFTRGGRVCTTLFCGGRVLCARSGDDERGDG